VGPPLAAATLDRGSSNLTGAYEARKFGSCWANRSGARVRVELPLASKRRRIRRRDKGGNQNEVRSKRKRRVAVQLRPVSGRLDEKIK